MAIGGLTLGCALTNFYGMVTGTSILGLLDIFFGQPGHPGRRLG